MDALGNRDRKKRFQGVAIAIVLACCLGIDLPVIANQGMSDPSASNEHIESAIRSWFSLMKESAPGTGPLDGTPNELPLQFALNEVESLASPKYREFVSRLRSPYPIVEFEIDKLRSNPLEGNSIRVRFEIERRAVDEEGFPHVMRSAQTWIIRDKTEMRPVVVRIEESLLIPYPGTGPQIICY